MTIPQEPVEQSVLETEARHVTDSILTLERIRRISTTYLPHRRSTIELADKLQWLLFPGFFGPRHITRDTLLQHVTDVLTDISRELFKQVTGALRYEKRVESQQPGFDEQSHECDRKARKIIASFLAEIPRIRRWLNLDVQAAYDGDPAAQHIDEVIFCYPGLRALSAHRVAHELYQLGVPLLPRIIAEHAHANTGIDIHPGARIGKSFFIDHGTGVVIGETTVIGEHCKVYQGVTLGAKSFPKDDRGRLMRNVKRHPTLEDHVTVYAGATILGGDTVIGAGSVVNGGVFLTQSVPPGHVVRGPKVEIKLRSNPELPPGNYMI